MGLDIASKSQFKYHASYSGIHYLRYLSYKICGGEAAYGDYMSHVLYDWPFFIHLMRFPNLTWHSDCDGTYTKTGRVDPFYTKTGDQKLTLMTGSSRKLLQELEEIGKYREEFLNETSGWKIYDMLYPLVKDVVKNHDGKLEFC